MTGRLVPEDVFRELLRIAKEQGLTELAVTTPQGKFKISRRMKAPLEPARQESPHATGQEKTQKNAEARPGDLVMMISPLMGVFYRAPAPGVEPFVNVGERVEIGDTLCVIEAMKVMNEITAEVTGTIREIIPKNGDVVEEGALLFTIKPEKQK